LIFFLTASFDLFLTVEADVFLKEALFFLNVSRA